MLKIFPLWPNELIILAEDSLEFLPRNCWYLTACPQRAPNTNFLIMTREFGSQSSSEKKTVDQLLHCVQTEETDRNMYSCNRIVFLQSIPHTAAVVTIVLPFVRKFSKPSSPELRNFRRHVPADSHLRTAALETRCSTVCLNRSALLHHWETEKCICMQQIRRFLARLLSPTATLYTPVWKRCERAYMATK
jgi:hypothetical protein